MIIKLIYNINIKVVSTYVPIDTVALHSTTTPGITATQIHPE